MEIIVKIFIKISFYGLKINEKGKDINKRSDIFIETLFFYRKWFYKLWQGR